MLNLVVIRIVIVTIALNLPPITLVVQKHRRVWFQAPVVMDAIFPTCRHQSAMWPLGRFISKSTREKSHLFNLHSSIDRGQTCTDFPN